MAGINLVKRLKERATGEASGGSGSRRNFAADVDRIKEGWANLANADKIRAVLFVAALSSIYFARVWVGDYTLELETVKRQEIETVHQQVAAERQKLEQLKGLAQESEAVERQLADLRRRLTIIQSLGKNRNLAVRMVDYIVGRMPERLWLRSLALETKVDSVVKLIGNASDMQTVSRFMKDLEGAVFFPSWALLEAQKTEEADTGKPRPGMTTPSEYRSFSLNAKVVPL